jgi:pathogenesis-related protein 1
MNEGKLLDEYVIVHDSEHLSTLGEAETNAYGPGLYTPPGQASTEVLVQGWINEKKDYHGGPIPPVVCTPSNCSGPGGVTTGHYTQIVWRTTTEVGCEKVLSSGPVEKYGGGTYQGAILVCRYSPPGNFIGHAPY